MRASVRRRGPGRTRPPRLADNGEMPSTKHGANIIRAGELTFLLVSTGSEAVHLASETPYNGRGAVPKHWLDAVRVPTVLNYDRAELLAPRWLETTLCGREWAGMAANDGGTPTGYHDDVAYAPTCRRCMESMDRHFPKPKASKRLDPVAKAAADLLGEHGYAEVRHVPGDQQKLLRSAVRSLVRKQTGHSVQSLVHEAMVIFTCDSIYDLKRDEHGRAAMEAVAAFLATGETRPSKTPAWRLSWSTPTADA